MHHRVRLFDTTTRIVAVRFSCLLGELPRTSATGKAHHPQKQLFFGTGITMNRQEFLGL
jgi:hypothetical protein